MTDFQLPSMAQVLSSSPSGIIVYTPDLVVRWANPAYYAMVQTTPEALIGNGLFDVFPDPPDDPDAGTEAFYRETVERAVRTKTPIALPPVRHDTALPNGRHATRYWEITLAPVLGDDGAVSCVLQHLREITERTLRDQTYEARERAATQGLGLSFFDLDLTSRAFVRSPSVDRAFGYTPGEVGEHFGAFLDRVHEDDVGKVEAMLKEASEPGGGVALDHRVALPSGELRWVAVQGEVVPNPETSAPHLVGVLLDVTATKRGEDRLRAALQDRDLLIGEVNHRVKNSLQLVASILSLEAGSAKTRETKDKLAAARDRIDAIAAIHAALYQGEDVRRVAFGDYLERLCDHLITSLGAERRGVALKVEADPVLVETNKAITLSLVVNELVTNSFKHAFSEDGGGTVSVRLRRDDAATVTLTVADDGTGTVAEPLDQSARPSGLGTRLIAGSVRQLQGSMRTEGGNGGWATIITFPIPEHPAGERPGSERGDTAG